MIGHVIQIYTNRFIGANKIANVVMSALGQKPTFGAQKGMSALPPIATAKADMPQMVMSALPPKADMCGAVVHVR
jgi:hypothetical protein